jgi:hypothetical protein
MCRGDRDSHATEPTLAAIDSRQKTGVLPAALGVSPRSLSAVGDRAYNAPLL